MFCVVSGLCNTQVKSSPILFRVSGYKGKTLAIDGTTKKAQSLNKASDITLLS